MEHKTLKGLSQHLLVPFFIIAFLLNPRTILGQGILRQIDAPGPNARGLAWDGQYLWCADAVKDSIFKIDPATGQVMHSIYFDVNGTFGGGLTWNGDGSIWITRMWYFRRLDASTGEELANFYCPCG